jgi:RNA-directed DNA polymerase
MKTYRALFPRLCDPNHLDAAVTETCRGKRSRPDVAWFLFRREDEVARLVAEVREGRWRPEGFELLYLREPKRRVIARAPIADRVVQGALALLMEPIFLRSAMPESYACRPGFGTHRAVLRLQELMRRYRFVVHLDIRSYFPSVDLERLRGLVARRIRDARFLAVVDAVLESGRGLYETPAIREWARMDARWPPPGRGLPIGTRTSQLFAAHVYLDGLDRFIKRDLQVPGYVRYCDDLCIFGQQRASLRSWRAAIGSWLWEERGLRLKCPGARLLSCTGHINVLGYRIRRAEITALPRTLQRMKSRLGVMARSREAEPQHPVVHSLRSSMGALLF